MTELYLQTKPNNTVTVRMPFTSVDIGTIADAMKIEDIGNFDKDENLVDNAIMAYDADTETWSGQRNIFVDSIANENGTLSLNGMVQVENLQIGDYPIDEYISDKVKTSETLLVGISPILIEDIYDDEGTLVSKNISLEEVEGLGGGTAGSSTTIPVITYDTYGRITAIESVPIDADGDGSADVAEHNHNDLYYTKEEVNALIQAITK